MAEPVLYHRAPAGVELYARVLERLPQVFRTRERRAAFAASGSGAMDSAVANLVRPGTKALACAAGKFGERWIELCEAYGADLVKYEPGWGKRLDPQEIGRLLDENPGIEVVYATLSETSTGIVHDIEAIAAVVREQGALLVRRRRLRPRRREARAGRVGGGRRRRRLAEGADDPAGPRVRVRLAARARRRRREAGRPLLLRLGRDRQAAAQGPAEQPLHAAGHAARGARRLARHDRGRGDRERVGAPRAARARHARRGAGARPRALRRPGRALERRHRDRAAGVDRRQGRCRRSCATATASPPTAASRSCRARSCASPTAATSAASTSSRRCRAWR